MGAYFRAVTYDDDNNNKSTTGSYLQVSHRLRYWQGPYFNIVQMKHCLIPDTPYLFSAKLRLTKPDGGEKGSSGSVSN